MVYRSGRASSGQYAAVAAVVIATLLTMAYFMGLFVRIFGGKPGNQGYSSAEMPLALRACVGVLCAGIITLGLCSDPIVKVLLDATSSLRL